jgi:hypothetical protein
VIKTMTHEEFKNKAKDFSNKAESYLSYLLETEEDMDHKEKIKILLFFGMGILENNLALSKNAEMAELLKNYLHDAIEGMYVRFVGRETSRNNGGVS